jgi:protein-export membrane protein SecD
MRTLVSVCLVIAAACGGKSEQAKAGVTRITYDVDLDKAIDDRGMEIKRDLEVGTPGTTVTLAPTGVITAAPSDPSTSAALRTTITSSYSDHVEARECAAGATPGAVCFAIAAPYAVALKQAALAQAAKTLEHRLVELKLPGATAVPKGNQLVVELRGDSAEMLAAMRKLLPRSGVLQFMVVDDGTAFMKRVYQKVGSDGMEGKATDPEALAANISGGIDQWRPEDIDESHADFYLRGPERNSLERYFARIAASDPTFALPPDRVLGFELLDPELPGDPPLWRSYLLERKPAITGAAIANAEMVFDPNTNRPLVLLDFGREGARTFGDVTTRIAGKKLAVVLDGTVKSAPIINGPIRGGRASITMSGTDPVAQQQEATDLALVLRSGALPAPLREVAVDVVP